MSLNTLNLKQKLGGRVIKQADRSSTFKFALQDSNGTLINLNGQTANISLYNPNSKRYWETTAKVTDTDVQFKLPGNLKEDDYILEIACNGYVFPSDNDFIIEVVKGYKDLPDLKTAESYKKSIEEITQDYINQSDKKLKDNLASIDNTKKQIDTSIVNGVKEIKDTGNTYINNIKTNFDVVKTEFNKNAKAKTDFIDSKGNDYIALIGKKKDQALNEIGSSVKTETDKYLENHNKEINEKIDEALISMEVLSDGTITTKYNDGRSSTAFGIKNALNGKVDKVSEEVIDLTLSDGLSGYIKAKKDAVGGVRLWGNVIVNNVELTKKFRSWAKLPTGYISSEPTQFGMQCYKLNVESNLIAGMLINTDGTVVYAGLKNITDDVTVGYTCRFNVYFKTEGAW